MIALYVLPKNSNHLRSHSRSIMALDHSRLGLENKFFGNKSGRIFCVRRVYLTKSCQQIWECVNQPFTLFIHDIWGETVLFIIQTSDRMPYFTIFQDKLHSVNIQNDQSWVFSETVQKISKITYMASRCSLLTNSVSQCELWSRVWMNSNRVRGNYMRPTRTRTGMSSYRSPYISFHAFTWDRPKNELRAVWLRVGRWPDTSYYRNGPRLYRSHVKRKRISDRVHK